MNSENIYISHLLPDEEMRQLIENYDAGIEVIDFGISDNLDRLSENIRTYRERMKQMGVQRLTIHGPFLDLNPASYDRKIQSITRERFASAYEAARELGADKIIFHSCMNPQIHFAEGWAEKMADFLNDFMAERREIPVMIENVLDPDWRPLKELMELSCGIPNLGICLDLGHAHCYTKIPVEEWMRELRPWIRHLHLHDNMGFRDEHRAIGAGTLPWNKLASYWEDRTDLTSTIECSKFTDVVTSLERLKKLNEK